MNPANIRRGANHMAEGDTTKIIANRVKVQLTIAEWETIRATINKDAAILIDARREVLLGYHYALHRLSHHLEKDKSKIRKKARVSQCVKQRIPCRKKQCIVHKQRKAPQARISDGQPQVCQQKESVRNLNSSFLSVDERRNIIPKTPKAALVAAQAYLFTTQPTHQGTHENICIEQDCKD
jgi:hypothetical protein